MYNRLIRYIHAIEQYFDYTTTFKKIRGKQHGKKKEYFRGSFGKIIG